MTIETSERYWRHPSGAVGVEVVTFEEGDEGTVRLASGVMPEDAEPITKATFDAEMTAAAAVEPVDHRAVFARAGAVHDHAVWEQRKRALAETLGPEAAGVLAGAEPRMPAEREVVDAPPAIDA